jgi:hypothetical protein
MEMMAKIAAKGRNLGLIRHIKRAPFNIKIGSFAPNPDKDSLNIF